MLKKVKDTINNYQMINNDQPIVIGVSGGPDSMVLLDALTKLVANKLIVAHLNHKFRGKDADEDAEFVRKESEEKGIIAEIREFDVPAFMKETGLGGQEAAREVRYKFYREIAEKWNAKFIALGHHANDQAETILMRILRGAGTRGLSGIPYSRDLDGYKIIRPLLDISREEIESYCLINSIPYRTDKSNLSNKYFRNEIRLNVIPFLGKYNKNLILHLQQLAKIVQDENNYLNNLAQEILEKNNIKKEKESYILDIKLLQKLDITLQRRLIHLILNYLNLKQEITFGHIEDIINLAKHSHPAKSIDLSGVRVYRDYEQLILTKIINVDIKPYKFKINIPGELILNNINKKITIFLMDKFIRQKGDWAVFDYDLLTDKKLTVRSREKGDRIQIHGLNGSKKVKDLFIDIKLSRLNRETQPIVENDGNIIWIPGIKRSNHALISDKTKNYLYIVVEDIN